MASRQHHFWLFFQLSPQYAISSEVVKLIVFVIVCKTAFVFFPVFTSKSISSMSISHPSASQNVWLARSPSPMILVWNDTSWSSTTTRNSKVILQFNIYYYSGSRLMWSRLMYQLLIEIRTQYYYHLVNIISFHLFQCDHIYWLPLYFETPILDANN